MATHVALQLNDSSALATLQKARNLHGTFWIDAWEVELLELEQSAATGVSINIGMNAINIYVYGMRTWCINGCHRGHAVRFLGLVHTVTCTKAHASALS